MIRERVFSGTEWEPKVGYCRAIKVGNMVFVAGTTAVDEHGQTVGLGDPYMQTKFILDKIEKAIQQLGGKITDVVRTRMYVTNINDWELIGQAHGEFFSTIRPVTTMVEVSKLISPDFLVEIEVDAVLD